MTFYNEWRILQLFGGEGTGSGSGAGAGGASADGGANAAAPGDDTAVAAQNLRDRGIPEDKIAKYGKAYAKRAKRFTENAHAHVEQQAAAAAEAETAQTEEGNRGESRRYDWDEIMKDPEMNRRMQETVKASKKKSQAAEDAMEALAPVLRTIAEEKGMDPDNIDYISLAKHLSGEYEDRALKLGLPTETVAKMDQQDRINEEYLNRKHIEGLVEQAEKMKTVFPNFDLRKELENPAFVRLTSRGVNVPVEDAYYLVHRREMEQTQAQIVEQKATQRVQNTIRANAARPVESGAKNQASSVMTIDWKNASHEQIEARKRAIRAAAAQGRRFYPGE